MNNTIANGVTKRIREILERRHLVHLTEHISKIKGPERGFKNDDILSNLRTSQKLKKAIPEPSHCGGVYKLVFEYTNTIDKVVPTCIEKDRIIAITVYPARRGRYL